MEGVTLSFYKNKNTNKLITNIKIKANQIFKYNNKITDYT